MGAVMARAKEGDRVMVHYAILSEDGNVLDLNINKEPLIFTLGQGMVITGMDKAVIGMNKGDVKTVTIPPKDAYGNYDEEQLHIYERSKLPPAIDPYIGMTLQARSHNGVIINVQVTGITDDTVILDRNHPFAGMEIKLDIKLLEILGA
jgi:peptidylprolyl isomerase